MKRSIVLYKSYCQLLRLWSHPSARLGSSVYSCCGEKSQTLLASSSHLNRISSVRSLCTTTTEEDPEEGYDDEDSVEFTVPIVPVFHKENFSAKIRSQHNDPTKHTMEDYGMYYRLSQEDYEKFIKNEQWPGYKKMVNTFQEAVMMVRQPALEAFSLIDNANYDYPPLRLFFYGKVGSGKSMSLSHVVHRCSKQGMLVIHLQSMSNMIRNIRTVIRPHAMSDYAEGQIDLIDDAMNWLIHFKLQNEDLLKQLSIKTTKEYVWSIRESAEIGTDLLAIIDFGIDRKRYASDCIGAIFREIKKVASEKSVKVLVAVEGVNGLWKDTSIKDEERQKINAQKVTTFQHFQKLFEPNWTNGICVGTLCPSIETLDNKMYTNKMDVPYTPQYILKKEGFDFLDPFIPILVPEFNYKEAHNCIDYYIDRKWINKPKSLTEGGRKELMMLSNMNPYQMMTLSSRF